MKILHDAVSATHAMVGLAVVLSAYLLLWWSMPGLPFLDLPNHVARAAVMSDLLFGEGGQFADEFSLRLTAVPYVLGDLGLAALVWIAGASAAGRLWVILSFACLPLAVLAFMKLQGFRRSTIVVALLMTTYLATDWFFMSGFMSFRLAVAFTVLCIGFLCSMLDRAQSTPLVAGYVCSLAAGYFTHLSALVFVTAAAGALTLIYMARLRVNLRTVALVLAPLAFLWLLYLTGTVASEAVSFRGDIVDKVTRTITAFVRFDGAIEGTLLVAFVLTCAAMCGGLIRQFKNERVIVYAVVAAAFFATYLALPKIQGTVFEIDSRALPLMWTFIMFAALAAWEANHTARYSGFVIAAFVLAAANLSLLTMKLRPRDQTLQEIRAIAGEAPAGSRVLPVNTIKLSDRTQPFGHAGAWATIDRGALTPYIFGGDAGDPMSYFSYKNRPQAPWAFECTLGDCVIDWNQMGRTYDFVLVAGRLESAMIKIPTTVVARNASAALLRIDRVEDASSSFRAE
jgi:hypothetical protein